VLVGVYGLLVVLPPTRELAYRLQVENSAIEWLTFLLLFLGGVFALRTVSRAGGLARAMLLLGGLAFLVAAGEEIAWGQHLLGHPVNEEWAAANRQGETTLHNLGPFQGKSELLYLVGTLCGLLAARPAFRTRLGPAAAGSRLVPGLVLVGGFALAEVVLQFVPPPRAVVEGMRMLDEPVELVIGYVAFLWAVTAFARVHGLADGPDGRGRADGPGPAA
jgi:hypothetical protein